MTAQNISLNGLNLQSTSIITQKFQHEGIVTDQAKMKITHRDGEKLTSYTYGSRSITLEGHLYNGTASGLDNIVDTFKQSVIGALQVPLVYDYLGSQRQYTVNVKNVAIARDYYNINIVPFSIQAEAINPPFAMDIATTTTYSGTSISGALSTSATFSGTANPQPTLTFSVTTAGTLSQIIFTNSTTNTALTINLSSVSNGNSIVVSTSGYTVTKNGAAITTYSGTYPIFNPGSNSFNVACSGTGYVYDLTIGYTAHWL